MKLRAQKNDIFDFDQFMNLSTSLDTVPCDSVLAVKLKSNSEILYNRQYKSIFPEQKNEFSRLEGFSKGVSGLYVSHFPDNSRIQSCEVSEVLFIDGSYFKINGMTVTCEEDHQSGPVFPMFPRAPDIQNLYEVFDYDNQSDKERAETAIRCVLSNKEFNLYQQFLICSEKTDMPVELASRRLEMDVQEGQDLFGQCVDKLVKIFKYEGLDLKFLTSNSVSNPRNPGSRGPS